jgi:hypothetical protein
VSGIRQAYIQKYSTRSLKKFRAALRDCQVGLDRNPAKWDLKLVFDEKQDPWGTRATDYDCRVNGEQDDDMLAMVANMCDSYEV